MTPVALSLSLSRLGSLHVPEKVDLRRRYMGFSFYRPISVSCYFSTDDRLRSEIRLQRTLV